MNKDEIILLIVPLAVGICAAAGIDIRADEVTAIITGITAAAITAYGIWQRNTRKKSDVELQATTSIKDVLAGQVAALSTPDAATPEVISTLPGHSWKMDNITRAWIKQSETPADQALVDVQINAAEAQHLVKYKITTSRGYYDIEYGLMKGSGKNEQ